MVLHNYKFKFDDFSHLFSLEYDDVTLEILPLWNVKLIKLKLF